MLSNSSIKKILLVRFSSLGDVLLTTPVIRALKNKYNEATIDFVVKSQFKDVYSNNPGIDHLLIYDKSEAINLKAKLRAKKYDLVIDLQNNWRSRSLTRRLNTEIIRFNKPTLKKLLLVLLKINLLKEKKSIVERYAEAIPGLKLDGPGLELNIPPEIKPTLEYGKLYIGICPGAKHFTKRWPAEYYIKLGNELSAQGIQIAVFGGSSEKALCELIASKIDGCINLQNNDDLYQLAADMKMCKLIISNDSGLMHITSAIKVPVVAIFGSTVQEFGFAPYMVKNLILENNFISCRPCSHIGRSGCPKKHFKCMYDLTPQIVLDHINKLLPIL